MMILQGYEADDSDAEWDEHIRREYGESAVQGEEIRRNPAEANVDVVELLRNTFGTWDDIQDTAANQANAREGVPPQDHRAQGQGENGNFPGEGAASFHNQAQDNMTGTNGDSDEHEEWDGDYMDWGDPEALDEEAAAEIQRIQEVSRIPLYEGSPIRRISDAEEVGTGVHFHRSLPQ